MPSLFFQLICKEKQRAFLSYAPLKKEAYQHSLQKFSSYDFILMQGENYCRQVLFVIFFVIQPEALTRTTLNYPMEIRGHNADKLFILQDT